MTDATTTDKDRAVALDGISVAPPGDDGTAATPPTRETASKDDPQALKRDPTHADSRLAIELEERIPTSDAITAPPSDKQDAAPSAGADKERERAPSEAGE